MAILVTAYKVWNLSKMFYLVNTNLESTRKISLERNLKLKHDDLNPLDGGPLPSWYGLIEPFWTTYNLKLWWSKEPKNNQKYI